VKTASVETSPPETEIRRGTALPGMSRRHTVPRLGQGGVAASSPVTVAFASVAAAGNLTGSTTPGDHPNAGASPVDRLRSVNRYWTFTNSGLSFTNYSATFNFVAGDLDAGVNTNAFIVGKLSGGAWTTPTVGLRTSGST